MIEVTSHLTKEEWLRFNLAYLRASVRPRRGLHLLTAGMFAFLFVVTAIRGINYYFFFQWYTLRLGMSDPVMLEKLLLMFVFLVLLLAALYRLDDHFSQTFARNRLKKWLQRPENHVYYQESRVRLDEEAIATFSPAIDLRVAWGQVVKVVETEEVLVAFATEAMCVVLSKKGLEETTLTAIRDCIHAHHPQKITRL